MYNYYILSILQSPGAMVVGLGILALICYGLIDSYKNRNKPKRQKTEEELDQEFEDRQW